MKIKIPVNINLESILTEIKPSFSFNQDKAHFFLHLITELKIYRRDFDSEDGYVPISSQILQHYGIRDFKDYREYFVKADIIEHSSFSEGKARQYRFTPEYWTERVTYQTPKNKFWKRVEKLRKEYYRSSVPKNAGGYDIVEYFNSNLTIELYQAMEQIGEQYWEDYFRTPLKAHNKKEQRELSVQYINEGRYYKSVDTYGRLHTNITSLSTDLRQYLRWNGECLINVDFVNSQPMLASLLFEPDFWKEDSTINYKSLKGLKYADYRSWHPYLKEVRFYSDVSINGDSDYFSNWVQSVSEKSFKHSSYITSTTSTPSLPTSNYTLILTRKAIPLYSTDIQSFIATTRDGEFYEYFAERLNLPIDNRKEIKSLVFAAFFGSPTEGRKKLSKEKKLFKQTFPHVIEMFDAIKSSDSKKLAHMLQSLESKIVFEYLVPHLKHEFIDMPIFTIHDSFLVPRSMAESVKEAVIFTFKELFNFEPKLHVK